MTFRIKLYRGEQPTGDEHWTDIFGEAKAIAENAVSTGVADRVEIFDQDGRLVLPSPPTGPESGE